MHSRPVITLLGEGMPLNAAAGIGSAGSGQCTRDK